MKMILIILSVLGFSLVLLAQDSPPGTDRSEGLQIKAKLDYEKKARAPMQKSQGQNQGQALAPNQKSEPRVVPSVAAQSFSEMPKPHSSKVLLCKNGSEVRDLSLEYKGLGCELFYVKAGQSKSQARQINGTTICESVYEKMKSTLEKTGFSCESKKD